MKIEELSKNPSLEFERSVARAQLSLARHDAQEFRAAVQDLQILAGQTGRWQSAVKFLARSIELAPASASSLARS